MKRFKYIISIIAATAIAVTACNTDESVLIPTEATVTTEITETEATETTASPSVTVTAAPSPRISETPIAAAETAETTEENVEDSDSSDTSEQEQTNAQGEAVFEPASEPESSSRYTPVPKPTEDTRYMKHISCCDCGNETLVYTPNYRYTTPEKSHVETNPTWDYGIRHCEVQINWMHSECFTDEEFYNGHFDEHPDITEPFEFMVDMDGNAIENWEDAYYEALDKALSRAHAWTESIGIKDPRCSWQVNGFYSEPEKINYEENPYNVIDEPEHEYECTAYICDTCGAVEIDWRDIKQIR